MGEVMGQLEHVGARRASHSGDAGCRRLPRAGVLLLALLLPGVAPAGDTGQRVHRCVGHNGEIVFSGLRCSEEASAVTASAAAAAADLPRADECARSGAELRERMLAAIARHDANAIAAMMHWGGVGGAAARQRMAELRALVAEPLLSLDVDADGLSLRSGGAGAGVVHFGVYADGACHWLEW